MIHRNIRQIWVGRHSGREDDPIEIQYIADDDKFASLFLEDPISFAENLLEFPDLGHEKMRVDTRETGDRFVYIEPDSVQGIRGIYLHEDDLEDVVSEILELSSE